METTSTPLLLWVAFAALVTGIVAGRFWPREEDPVLTYAREQVGRLAAAQHWARAGVLAEAGEPWRPICTGLAVAALCLDDLGDLAKLGDAMQLDSKGDGELFNVWTNANAELSNSRQRVTPAFFPGEWAPGQKQQLRARSAELLQNAQQGARNILTVRRVPSVPPSA